MENVPKVETVRYNRITKIILGWRQIYLDTTSTIKENNAVMQILNKFLRCKTCATSSIISEKGKQDITINYFVRKNLKF